MGAVCLHQSRRSMGAGSGSLGQGGGVPPESEATSIQPDKKSLIKGSVTSDETVGKQLIRGLPRQGEALVKYTTDHQASKEAAAEALTRDRIPFRYRSLVRDYFESIAPPPPSPTTSSDGPTKTEPTSEKRPR